MKALIAVACLAVIGGVGFMTYSTLAETHRRDCRERFADGEILIGNEVRRRRAATAASAAPQ